MYVIGKFSRQAVDKFSRADKVCSVPHHFFRDLVITKGNVVKDGITEQKHILKYDADILSSPTQFILIDIHAVDEYSPTVDLIKTVKQIYYRRLSCTGSSHKSNCFPRPDIKVDVF